MPTLSSRTGGPASTTVQRLRHPAPGPIPTPMPAARSSASSITSSCPSPAQSARQMRGWRYASRATPGRDRRRRPRRVAERPRFGGPAGSATPIGAISAGASRPGQSGSARPSGRGSRCSVPPSRSPFEYAVVRVVPDIEREGVRERGAHPLLPAAQLPPRGPASMRKPWRTQARLRYRRHPDRSSPSSRAWQVDRWPPGRSPG